MHINELIAGCKDGSARHFDVLYETYSYALYGICRKYSHDDAEAKDIFQEGFIKVFTQIKTFDPARGSFDSWLKKIFVHQAVDHYRKKAHSDNPVPLEDIAEATEEEEEVEVKEEEYDLSEKQLLALVRKLPAGYRTVFNLFVLEEMKHKEIAEELGISESTSKSQFQKARKMLKEKIIKLVSKKKHPIQ